MAGANIVVGGYDNFSRRSETPGGFFYLPTTNTGGSPENWALRPSGDTEAYSPEQASAFTRNVLADLSARQVFTPTGQGAGLDYYNSISGAPLGAYGQSAATYALAPLGTAFQMAPHTNMFGGAFDGVPAFQGPATFQQMLDAAMGNIGSFAAQPPVDMTNYQYAATNDTGSNG